MKKSLVTTLASIIVLLCCTAVQAQPGHRRQTAKPTASPSPVLPKAPGYGVITDSVYHNSYFGLRITIPAGWSVHGDDVKQEIMETGKANIVLKDERDQAAMDAAAARTVFLLTISKVPLGTPDQLNANFSAAAEPVPLAATGPVYIEKLKEVLQQASFPVHFVADDQVETINGVQFHTLTVILNPDQNQVRQKYYVLIKKGYALGLITSIVSESDTEVINSILRSVTVR